MSPTTTELQPPAEAETFRFFEISGPKGPGLVHLTEDVLASRPRLATDLAYRQGYVDHSLDEQP